MHNKKHRPNLKEKELFALRNKDGCFVTHSLPMRVTKDPTEARHFSGGYLNVAAWDWTLFLEAVPVAQLKRSHNASKAKSAVKGALTSKRCAVGLLCVLITLSASATPVTRMRGPVRITSWRPLGQLYRFRGNFVNMPNAEPRTSTVGLVARPIKYRPIKGAE